MSKKKIIISSLLLLLATIFFIAKILWSSPLSSTIYDLRSYFPYLLGQNKPTTYLVLLGNDTETRANGGFSGSYTKIALSSPPSTIYDLRSTIPEIKSEFSFHDIYVPNGQLSGHVKSPEAIQQAFGKGTWELANADYEPHFPTSATTIRWFLEKGNETNPDVLGIINLSTIKKVLNIIGEFKLQEGNKVITPDNLYLYLQGKAEVDFFPGSTQKADALHSVGTAALKKIYSLSLNKKIQIAKIIYQDLKNQNIVLNSTDPTFQKFLEDNHFAGAYRANTYDYYGLVEMNLGANKANQYVTRQTTHNITTENDQLKHTVSVDFQNTSPEKNPNPPLHYGGHYLGYFRIYLPQAATNIQLTHSEYLPCSSNNIQYCYESTSSANINQSILENQNPVIANDNTISFWHPTLAGQHSNINLSYNLPLVSPENYSLTVLKQNGLPSSPQNIILFGQSYTTNLYSSYIVPK